MGCLENGGRPTWFLIVHSQWGVELRRAEAFPMPPLCTSQDPGHVYAARRVGTNTVDRASRDFGGWKAIRQ